MNTNYDLVPPALAIKAMRDNGYRNTAYAIAELIDNAIQAQASSVELLCCERESFVRERNRRNIHQIAILDNGLGMDRDVLSQALQFGNGAYLNDRSGIGRFGMGLPSSSISQSRKVEVWTWQSGHENALYSYIDLDKVESRDQNTVPEPKHQPIPEIWLQTGRSFTRTGTLVVWSTLDRVIWKTARSIIKNSNDLIGRIYRRFIGEGSVRIRMVSFVDDKPDQLNEDHLARVNDPIYLMVPSSTPDPYDKEAMFRHDGDRWEIPTKIEYQGQIHQVITRFTVAKEETRNRPNAGSTPYGNHAKKNVGISLMRADRELDLDTSLVIQFDTRERWWGVEVEFPPALDEVFGVTNNKQTATHFTEIATTLDEILSDVGSIVEFKERMREEDNPQGPLIDIIYQIRNRLGHIRNIIKVQTKGTGSSKRHSPATPEAQGTNVTRQRQKEGYRGASDKDEQLPATERQAALAKELEETGLSNDQALELSARTISEGTKYAFATTALEGRSFFTVKAVAGELVIKLNINHPAYKHLVEVLEETDEDENLSQVELLSRLREAGKGLRLLFIAWARFEDEAYPEKRREDIQDLRYQWGHYAAQFLENEG